MRILTGVLFNGARSAAIGVALTQHWVDGAAEYFRIALADRFFFVSAWIVGEVGNCVSLGLQLFDGRFGLGDGGADVWQLDDVGFGRFGQLTKFGQRVGRFLIVA